MNDNREAWLFWKKCHKYREKNPPKAPTIMPIVVHFIAPGVSNTPLDKTQPIKAKTAQVIFCRVNFSLNKILAKINTKIGAKLSSTADKDKVSSFMAKL